MSSRIFRVALSQLNVRVGVDKETLMHNTDLIIGSAALASSEECDCVVTPELAICGYSPEDILLRKDIQEQINVATGNLCDKLLSHNSYPPVFFGAPRTVIRTLANGVNEFPQGLHSLTSIQLGESALANAILCTNPSNGDVHEVYKVHLPNWGVFDEPRIFAAASHVADPIEIKGMKIGVLNCRDVWIQSAVSDLVALGAHCIVVPNASPYANVRHSERKRVVSGYAKKYGIPIIYVNSVHGCDELIFDGGSFVANAMGEVIYEAKRFEQDFEVVDIEIPEKPQPDKSVEIKEDLSGSLSHVTFEPSEAYRAIVLGVKEFIDSISSSVDVVIGISGGLDSALVATIAVDALGSSRVHGVMMPSKFTSEQSTRDAVELCRRLAINHKEISIEDMYDMATKSLGLDDIVPIASENVQSRLRGLTLMAQSNAYGWLVLSTSNKSETAVGYATLYGDTVGAYAPIKDVYKSHVYDLCAWRNDVDTYLVSNPIPSEIIERPPTAELREDQFDEQALLPYKILDSILEKFIDSDMSVGEIIELGFQSEDVERIVGLVKASEFKRKQTPPGPRLTRRNFGKSRRVPISAHW